MKEKKEKKKPEDFPDNTVYQYVHNLTRARSISTLDLIKLLCIISSVVAGLTLLSSIIGWIIIGQGVVIILGEIYHRTILQRD